MITLANPVLILLGLSPFANPTAPGTCDDPLPIDPSVVTSEMKLKGFDGAHQAGPACHLRWDGGSAPALMIYGPTPMAELGRVFTSTKQAADEYAGESPKGVEPVPGVKGGVHGFRSEDAEPAGVRGAQGEGVHDRVAGSGAAHSAGEGGRSVATLGSRRWQVL